MFGKDPKCWSDAGSAEKRSRTEKERNEQKYYFSKSRIPADYIKLGKEEVLVRNAASREEET